MTRRTAGRWLLPALLIALTVLALQGCGISATRVAGLQAPTLVPTMAVRFPSASTSRPTSTLASVTPADNMPPALSSTETALPPEAAAPEATATEPVTITPGPSPTRTRIPTRTFWPTRTPTITPTPTPPLPPLNLVRPGLLSKVVSPIQAELYAVTGGDAKVTIELIGEDGRVISRQVEDYQRPGRYIWLAPKIPFEINGVAETARLQVLTHDEFGRLEGLISTDLVLLSVGRNEINPPAITEKPYLIRQPKRDAEISGGVLDIEGLARPVNDSPLLIELVSESGSAVSTKQVLIPPPTGDLSHTPFTVHIPYKVNGPTPVRLTLCQEGSRIPGIVALVSQTIVLYP